MKKNQDLQNKDLHISYHQQKNESRLQQVQRLCMDESALKHKLYFIPSLNYKEKVETLRHKWAKYAPALFQPSGSIGHVSINKASHGSNPEYPDPTNFDRHVINGKLGPVSCKCQQNL